MLFRSNSDLTTSALASLAAEVYDLLLESSRKELEALLAVFVKASSKQALEAVRHEAVQCGAFVAVKQSRFQQCNHAQLNSFFSFLEPVDLRTADVVCRRWRSACTHSNAGWRRALSNPQRNVDGWWPRALAQRRIKPTSSAIRIVSRSQDTLAFVGRVGSLTDVTTHQLVTSQVFKQMKSARLRALSINSQEPLCWPLAPLVLTTPFAANLASLRLPCEASALESIVQLPNLTALTIVLHPRHSRNDLVRLA